MSSPVVAWCSSCGKFCLAHTGIGGHGGTVIITGGINCRCPHCGAMATSPGGEFRTEHDKLVRISDNLSPDKAEELRSRLSTLKQEGYSVDGLKTLIEGYAPQLLPFIEQAKIIIDPRQKTHWLLFIVAMLFILAHSTTITLDINRLIDQAVGRANQEVDDASKEKERPRVKRNDHCPCGSGKKFKKCCGKAAK